MQSTIRQVVRKNISVFLPIAALAAAGLCSADTLSTYGDATVVTGPDGNPAWQLTSDSSGPNTYSGLQLQITGPLTPVTLTQLSADYVMLTGTFGGGGAALFSR